MFKQNHVDDGHELLIERRLCFVDDHVIAAEDDDNKTQTLASDTGETQVID